jgi:hypothetical protein
MTGLFPACPPSFAPEDAIGVGAAPAPGFATW